MQLLGRSFLIIPRMAEKDVPRVGQGLRLSTLLRTGMSARTSAGDYDRTGSHLGLTLLPDQQPLLRPLLRLPDVG